MVAWRAGPPLCPAAVRIGCVYRPTGQGSGLPCLIPTQIRFKTGKFPQTAQIPIPSFSMRVTLITISMVIGRRMGSIFGSVQESVSQPEFTDILILAKSGYTRQHARDRLDQGFRVAGVSGLPTGNQRRRQDTEAVGAA